ncbi:MAG: hypothetical protein CSA22_06570 [Deltaproteobacteria bacterium]|nr:MAG: hypothetical protein CSA22_06570 [Deltaproteobacteria bacterium]
MKKIIKLSLAVYLAFSTLLYADTLENAFANSKIKGEIKAQYFNIEPFLDKENDSIFVFGGNLNWVTENYYGFNAGVTFQASHVEHIDIKNENNFVATMDAAGAVMSESYLQYTLANTSIKAGRQYIATNLMAGSDSRMIKQSFEGVTIISKDIPDTILTLAYIDKYQDRTDGNGNPGNFNHFEDGAWTIHAENRSIENLTLKAQYLDVNSIAANSDKDAAYLEVGYALKGFTVAAQYLDTSNGNVDGKLYGFKVSGNIGIVNLTGLYSTTDDDGALYCGVGSGADPSFTALPLHGGSVTYTKETNTIVGIIGTKLAGVTLVGYYGEVHTDDLSLPYSQIDAFGGFAQYSFTKNFSAKMMYESADFNTLKNDDNIFRIYTSYKF